MQAPYVDMRDPFDAVKDITMEKKYVNKSVYRHKLDWLLYDIDCLYVKHCFVSKDCNASDHQYCLMDVAFGNNDVKRFRHWKRPPLPLITRIILWADNKLKP